MTRSSDAAAAIGMDKEPLSRVLALLDHRRRGGACYRRRGAQCVDGSAGWRDRYRNDGHSPQEVTRRSAEAGLKAVPTGIEHGTVTVIVSGAPFEVTTLREDVETYGRKAKVAFGRDWAADAKRRDFTINALSASRDGTIHDYVDGLRDIEARRVRFVGEPATRIAEDYLRILRFFRFHAAYGRGDLDPAGLHACIAGRAGLDTLSRERVRMELLKQLAAARAAATLAVMSDTGILAKSARRYRACHVVCGHGGGWKRRSARGAIRCAGLARSVSTSPKMPSGCVRGCG